MAERNRLLEPDMIMLIRTFHDVDVRPSELGNRQTGNSCVKHRSQPPPSPGMTSMLRFKCVTCNINKSLKGQFI